MKRILILFILLFTATGLVYARDYGKNKFTVGLKSDLVSSYIWRGSYNAGASIQPSLKASLGSFSLTAWGSVDFTASDYKEADLTISWSAGGLTLSLTDYYWSGSPAQTTLPPRKYFHLGADSPHILEAGAAWRISEKFPLTLAWNTMLRGNDRKNNGKQNYSTYAEVSYPFSVKEYAQMIAGIGFTPWATENIYGTTGFAVCNVFLGASKTWTVYKNLQLGLFTNLIWNPAKEDVNFVGGLSIGL